MGKIQRFSIVLMSPQIVFYPGQTVEGQVCVDLADDVKMKGIYISCISEGYAVWKVGKQVLRAKEDYLNLKLTLHGLPPNESGEVILPAGSHVFSFQFVLPNDLPGSYEGVNGSGNYVRHWLKATLDRPWKTNRDYRIMLCVAYVLDLNTIPDAEMPVEMKGKRDPSVVCCCYNGEITANFRIDKKGFVPGESIAIHGEVVDTMNIGINAVFVELIRKTLYKKDETGCHYDDLFLVTRLHHRRVAPGGSDLWNGEKLRIPPVAPSYLPGCNLIDLEYYLKVTVQLPGCTVGSNLVLRLPIIIGTVPLYSFVPQNMMVDSDNDLQQIQPVITQPQSCGLPYDMPPPSYQECIFGKVDASNDSEKHADENCKKYAPLYPYYESML